MKFMPPKEKIIIPPKDGWRENCYYIVEAAFSPTNPTHRYIFFTGFLNGGGSMTEAGNDPGGYNEIGFIEDGCTNAYRKVHYMKAIELIAVDHLHIGPIEPSFDSAARLGHDCLWTASADNTETCDICDRIQEAET